MKVLIILDSLVEAGAEKSMVEIAKNFSSFTPVFVYIYSDKTLRKNLEEAGIKVYALNILTKYGYREAVPKLISIYKTEEPDIVHSALYRADQLARKLKVKFPHIPLVGSFVNNSYIPLRYKNQSIAMQLKLWLAYKIDKWSSRHVDYFISNSETIKREEGKALGVDPRKIEVIYRGRDLDNFENVNPDKSLSLIKSLQIEDKKVLINISRLISRKAQIDIIRSLPAVLEKEPNIVLLIVGNGECEGVLKNEIKRLNLSAHAFMLGRRRDIPELLSISDVFVYPSYAEGLPGALIEAMMAEKIIVASNIEENLECINEKSALIFQKGNIVDLSNKILYALQNPNLKIGAQAKIQAAEKFEIGAISKKYEVVYKRLISEMKSS